MAAKRKNKNRGVNFFSEHDNHLLYVTLEMRFINILDSRAFGKDFFRRCTKTESDVYCYKTIVKIKNAVFEFIILN